MLKKTAGLLAVLTLAVVLPATAADTKIRCDSNDGRYKECYVGMEGTAVVERQWSKQKCVLGQNWGFENGVLWVDEGCRADFRVTGTSYNSGRLSKEGHIICESINGKRRHCPVDTSGGVTMVRKLSKSACDFKNDWGWDKNGVWVTSGCRAEFSVRNDGRVQMMSSSIDLNNVVVCESENGRRKHCPANTAYGVSLHRQLSDSSCVLNSTWGFDNRGVWVTSGCRAEFLLDPRRQ